MIINARSPYIITINEPTQIGSKIELFIWNDPNTQPIVATYVLSKKNPSLTQKVNYYDISNYISEYINNVNPNQTISQSYCNVIVKTYYENNAGVFTLLDTIDFIGVYGYNLYTDGLNELNEKTALVNEDIIIYYNRPQINFVTAQSFGLPFTAIYKDLTGANETTVSYSGDDKFYNIPFSTSSSNYTNGNTLLLDFGTINESKNVNIKAIPICEPKYAPVNCAFINRFGGWNFITFFKAQTNSINVSGNNYKFMPQNVNYNVYEGADKVFNINGKQTIRLNTGFVDENYSELMQDLLLSETILLDNKPVNVKTQSLTFKTSIFDKNINYELEFDYAYDLINNVI